MKVKLLISRSGPAGVQKAGDEVDLPDREAMRLMEQRKAVPVRDAGDVETTAAPRPRGRRKKG